MNHPHLPRPGRLRISRYVQGYCGVNGVYPYLAVVNGRRAQTSAFQIALYGSAVTYPCNRPIHEYDTQNKVRIESRTDPKLNYIPPDVNFITYK